MVVSEYDSEVINKVNHRNIALSRVAYGRGQVPIDLIARSFDLSVSDYNQAVHDTISYCYDKDTNFIELRQ